MEFSPTTTTESQQFPGIKFTVSRMGISRRTEIELNTADLRANQRQLQQAMAPLLKEDDAEDSQIRATLDRARRRHGVLARGQ